MKFFLSFVLGVALIVVIQGKETNTTPCSGSACSSVASTTAKVASTAKIDINKSANYTNNKNLKANDTLHNRLNTVATECKKELNAQQGIPEIMALLSSGALPTNEKQRCFLECVYNKVGLIKDGKVNEEGAMSLAKAKFGENKELMSKAEALFKKCKTEVVVEKDSKEKCALGRLIRTCIVNNGNNLPIFSKA